MSGPTARAEVPHGDSGTVPEQGSRPVDPPWLKLVVAMEDAEWTGTVYPTQSTKGSRQRFSSREELVEAVVRLTGWQPTA